MLTKLNISIKGLFSFGKCTLYANFFLHSS